MNETLPITTECLNCSHVSGLHQDTGTGKCSSWSPSKAECPCPLFVASPAEVCRHCDSLEAHSAHYDPEVSGFPALGGTHVFASKPMKAASMLKAVVSEPVVAAKSSSKK